MKDFILAALPFIIIGLCLAIIFANQKSKKNSHCSEGMCIGMCLGVAISTSLKINMGLGISLGMLIGETVGLLIPEKIIIKTKRLKIYPASKEQMEAFIEKQPLDELKSAYQEMLDGCFAHPDKCEWYAIWMIELKDGTHIGELCFKGISETGSTEIGYGVAAGYTNLGYATEAVTAAVNWALNHREINSVTAEVDKENEASVRVLEKSGFELTERTGEEGPIYRKTK